MSIAIKPGQKIFTVPGPSWGIQVTEPAAAEEYYRKVLGYGPIAYWPLWDALGSPTAEELVNSPAQDGAHTNVLLDQPGIGDGHTSGWYDGPAATTFTNVFTPAFQGVFAGGEYTVTAWIRVHNAGVWTDSAQRLILDIRVDATNRMNLCRHPNDNALRWLYESQGGGISTTLDVSFGGVTDWICMALTISETINEMRAYGNGAQVGPMVPVLGIWTGNITSALIGSWVGPALVWHGWEAHIAIFDYAIPPAGILDLATI